MRVLICVCFLKVAFIVNAQDMNMWSSFTHSMFGGSTEFAEENQKFKSVNLYWLYTSANPEDGQQLLYNDVESVINSYMDAAKVTVFLVHGWYGYYTDGLNTNITRALLLSSDVNVICVDWSAYSKSNYFTSSRAVPKIGTDLGDFINWLVSLGFDYDKVHIAGHSLGAHISGFAGRRTGGKVRRITGMDPAGPTWNNGKRLCPTDGQYVECIHTCAKVFGTTKPCGHADFYPDGGTFMPGCGIDMICAHFRGFYIFSASVLYPDKFVGSKCESVDDAMSSRCSGDTAMMGNGDVDKNLSGIYFLKTTDKYPFC